MSEKIRFRDIDGDFTGGLHNCTSDGTWFAYTATKNKKFKTKKSAINWLNKMGYYI